MKISIDQFCIQLAFLLYASNSVAEEVADLGSSPLKLSGYIEGYYSHDFNHASAHTRPAFIYSYNHAERPEINLALIKASFNTNAARANLGLAAGTYMNANYVAEKGIYQHIYEANIGLKLSDQHDIWLDAGVMPSHIGFESAIGADNWTLTRSMIADNSPYFETGAKLSYASADGKWYVSGLLLNGWQRIHHPKGNSTPSIGHQLTYKPTDKLTINSSSFIGNDKSDHARQMRYFHNLYAQWQVDDDWAVTAGLDIGAEQKPENTGGYNVWFGPIAIVKYRYSERASITARAEYYQDKHGVIISTDTPNGFMTQAYSINFDYRLHSAILWRTELRQFISKDKIFPAGDGDLSDRNLMATTALAVSF